MPILERQALRVSKRLKAQALQGNVINLKLKTAQFKTISRRKKITQPTDKAHEIFSIASEMLIKELAPYKNWRLLGVGVDGFDHGPQNRDFLDSLDEKGARKDKLEKALDDVYAKFGDSSVFSGRQITGQGKQKKSQTPKPPDTSS